MQNNKCMKTPIYDFVTEYTASNTARLHMPGHKGQLVLGCESRDITEISGADALYEASGIIAESEANAAALFGTGRTLYSTEGSSQCVKAMLELARRWWQKKRLVTAGQGNGACMEKPVVVAARNVHKSFMYAAALLDFEVVWLWSEEASSLCSCKVTEETLEQVLAVQNTEVAAVYLTSPDYLGNVAEVSALAGVCHRHHTLLCVDNAHGAYLHFLEEPQHPMDLGADMCCDSAHKTLQVLTGGAYLHISRTAPALLAEWAKGAMELFGSTSPSYLILQSLDVGNRYLAGQYRADLKQTCDRLGLLKEELLGNGWQVKSTDPLRITIEAPVGQSGTALADALRKEQIECEYADEDYLVLMVTEQNPLQDLEHLKRALGKNVPSYENKKKKTSLPGRAVKVLTIREAYFSPGEVLPVENALGKICRMPTATCPPAVPVVVPGERIDRAAVECFAYYGIKFVEVVGREKEHGKSNI